MCGLVVVVAVMVMWWWDVMVQCDAYGTDTPFLYQSYLATNLLSSAR